MKGWFLTRVRYRLAEGRQLGTIGQHDRARQNAGTRTQRNFATEPGLKPKVTAEHPPIFTWFLDKS
jgi:hypothetical protein